MTNERFDRDRLVAEAAAIAGSDDFGEDSWQEGLDVLLDGFAHEARLHELGVEIAAGGVTEYLATRAGITAWRAAHPAVEASASAAVKADGLGCAWCERERG